MPTKIKGEYAENEICCDCGKTNRSGIYIREDPNKVRFPKEEK
jgi:hypothetical protein